MALSQRFWLGGGLPVWLAAVLGSVPGCTGNSELPDRPGATAPGTGGQGTPGGTGGNVDADGGTSSAGMAGGTSGGTAGTAGGTSPGGPAAGVGTEVFAKCKDGKELPGPRLLRLMTRREFKNTVQDLLFLQNIDVSMLPLEARVQGFDNNAVASVVTSRHADGYLALGESLAKEAVEKSRGQLLPCDANQAAACSRTFVEKLGLRAFRRPLAAAEVERFLKLFAQDLTQGQFDEGMRLTIQAMLASPTFLYRSEVGVKQADGNFVLSAYEMASALSYLYWGSMPDQTLFDLAGKDQLKSQDQLRAQATRMLNDNKAKEQLGEFSMQWLRSEGVISANKDKDIYPNFRDSLREAMVQEQKRFFTKVVLEDRGTFDQLYTPSFTMVSKELATFYALPMPANDYDKVDVADTGRGGVLGFGAVMASHAHQNESSPIKRGLYVRNRLLCQVLPQPGANINTTPPGLDPKLTTRERFAKHTADTGCRSCHQFIDGVGFGLEGFDGVGQQRKVENNLPVDTNGEILGINELNDGSMKKFNGARELATALRDSDTAKACLALQYYRFGRGYEERDADACSLSALRQRFMAGGLTVRDLLENLPLLTSFSIRSAE
jgi:hypothetical protein